ncbi:MAG: PucR family transcriptional regulator ligand-binding domain-containing protein [Chloroflexi bacterium]|nr:PucR family transcriptional regulator ligand-binding domain-containing protein [Chloroflexota bacterium]
MLTVKQALALPEFEKAQIVAGHEGLDHAISWVHVVGVPDAPDFLNGGELVLTTPINLPAEVDGQRRYVEAMADKSVAALVLAVGRHLDHAPEDLRTIAEACDLPLIEIPYQTRFVDIARTLNERISHENMEMLERALRIHHVLTQLVLNGGDLKRLAATLAELIGQSISIENERFEALASHNIAPVDEARRYTLSEGRTNPRLIETLENMGILSEIRRELHPVHLPQLPEVGLEMERILAPIVVNGSIYGYLWIIADDRPLNQLDSMAIESGATVAALIRLHEEMVANAEATLKGGLLAQLIEGERGRQDTLTDQALRYGIDLNAPYVMLRIDKADKPELGNGKANGGSAEAGAARLQFQRRITRALADRRTISGLYAGTMVAIVPATASLAIDLEALHQAPGLSIGVSSVQRGAGSVEAAYIQCRDALHIARKVGMDARIVHFDQLGYLHTLYQAGESALAANPYAPLVRRLLTEQQADLFHTLEVYLDAGGNGVQTADDLHIHRSTLNYRLQRVAEICEADLGDPITRTNLQMALKLLRLFG